MGAPALAPASEQHVDDIADARLCECRASDDGRRAYLARVGANQAKSPRRGVLIGCPKDRYWPATLETEKSYEENALSAPRSL
jgi:hypothetical protein